MEALGHSVGQLRLALALLSPSETIRVLVMARMRHKTYAETLQLDRKMPN